MRPLPTSPMVVTYATSSARTAFIPGEVIPTATLASHELIRYLDSSDRYQPAPPLSGVGRARTLPAETGSCFGAAEIRSARLAPRADGVTLLLPVPDSQCSGKRPGGASEEGLAPRHRSTRPRPEVSGAE